MPQADGTVLPFAWYFAQREAVESVIWMYEVERPVTLWADEVRLLWTHLDGNVR